MNDYGVLTVENAEEISRRCCDIREQLVFLLSWLHGPCQSEWLGGGLDEARWAVPDERILEVRSLLREVIQRLDEASFKALLIAVDGDTVRRIK